MCHTKVVAKTHCHTPKHNHAHVSAAHLAKDIRTGRHCGGAAHLAGGHVHVKGGHIHGNHIHVGGAVVANNTCGAGSTVVNAGCGANVFGGTGVITTGCGNTTIFDPGCPKAGKRGHRHCPRPSIIRISSCF